MKVAEARVSPGHRTQEVEAPMRSQRTPHDRFWSKVDKSGDCWLWLAAKRNGYGAFSVSRSYARPAHVVAYELLVGPIPKGFEAHHICFRPACVRPGHMELLTHKAHTLLGTSPPAINARKTACDHGHAFDEANTHIRANGRRRCRACDRATWHRRAEALRLVPGEES